MAAGCSYLSSRTPSPPPIGACQASGDDVLRMGLGGAHTLAARSLNLRRKQGKSQRHGADSQDRREAENAYKIAEGEGGWAANVLHFSTMSKGQR